MARIQPLTGVAPDSPKQYVLKERMQSSPCATNMKATLEHSPLALTIYMQWYPLYQQVEQIVGKRAAYLYGYSISLAADCTLCTTFFRKLMIDAGDLPDQLQMSEAEKDLVQFGTCIAKCQGNIADHVYLPLSRKYTNQQLVVLIAFAGQMIATNIFNNVIETDLDDDLTAYLPRVQSIWRHA